MGEEKETTMIKCFFARLMHSSKWIDAVVISRRSQTGTRNVQSHPPVSPTVHLPAT